MEATLHQTLFTGSLYYKMGTQKANYWNVLTYKSARHVVTSFLAISDIIAVLITDTLTLVTAVITDIITMIPIFLPISLLEASRLVLWGKSCDYYCPTSQVSKQVQGHAAVCGIHRLLYLFTLAWLNTWLVGTERNTSPLPDNPLCLPV